MDILNQLAGTGTSRNKWTVEEDVAFFLGFCQGLRGENLAEHIQREVGTEHKRSKAGFNAKKNSVNKRLVKGGATEETTVEQCVEILKGQAQEVEQAS